MTNAKRKRTHEQQVDEIVEKLMHDQLPKGDRIRLMKDLVRRGDDLPDEVLKDALQRLLEHLLL